MILNRGRTIIGREWGLNPEKALWIYIAITRPKVTHGSLVWANGLDKTLGNKLKQMRRKVLLGISGALRSTPTDAMEVILGLILTVNINGMVRVAHIWLFRKPKSLNFIWSQYLPHRCKIQFHISVWSRMHIKCRDGGSILWSWQYKWLMRFQSPIKDEHLSNRNHYISWGL